MLSKSEIQNNLSLVAQGRLDPWDFYGWLQDGSWNMHQDDSEDARALVEDVKLAFEEYYKGLKDENALRECLASIPIVYVSVANPMVNRSVLPYRDVLMSLSQPRVQAIA